MYKITFNGKPISDSTKEEWKSIYKKNYGHSINLNRELMKDWLNRKVEDLELGKKEFLTKSDANKIASYLYDNLPSLMDKSVHIKVISDNNTKERYMFNSKEKHGNLDLGEYIITDGNNNIYYIGFNSLKEAQEMIDGLKDHKDLKIRKRSGVHTYKDFNPKKKQPKLSYKIPKQKELNRRSRM